jgi:hypothetical protein
LPSSESPGTGAPPGHSRRSAGRDPWTTTPAGSDSRQPWSWRRDSALSRFRAAPTPLPSDSRLRDPLPSRTKTRREPLAGGFGSQWDQAPGETTVPQQRRATAQWTSNDGVRPRRNGISHPSDESAAKRAPDGTATICTYLRTTNFIIYLEKLFSNRQIGARYIFESTESLNIIHSNRLTFPVDWSHASVVDDPPFHLQSCGEGAAPQANPLFLQAVNPALVASSSHVTTSSNHSINNSGSSSPAPTHHLPVAAVVRLGPAGGGRQANGRHGGRLAAHGTNVRSVDRLLS